MGDSAITSIESISFVHRELWRVVELRLEHGKQKPIGAFYDDLVAMLFAIHTLEAYLNYVGELLAPEIWKDEREYFRKKPYRGFDGKVRKVLELVGVMEPDRRIRPYRTVWLLKEFRDLIVHARSERFDNVVMHPVDAEPDLYRMPFNSMVTTANAELGREDIAAFIELIHSAARPKINDISFGSSALSGPFALSSAHTTMPT